MALPICPTGCSGANDSLAFLFSECAPEINAAEIRHIYIGQPNQPFTDWNSPTEWAARLLATNTGATKLQRLTVLADKPKPSGSVKDISGGRKVVLNRDHVLNATVDETNETNHNAFRKMECGGARYSIWYETSGGKLFGGNAGILVNIDPGMVISRAKADSIVWDLTMTWNTKFTEEMIVSPIA